jgi:hypothetical protein
MNERMQASKNDTLKTSLVALIVLAIAPARARVVAEYSVKVFFNNGLEGAGKSCSDADWAHVKSSM